MREARPIALVDVQQAAVCIHELVHRTPVLSSATLDARFGRSFFLKAEHLQRTGSFKVRGALNTLLALRAQDPELRGVVAFSAGNHAAAVAFAARSSELPAVVCMPAGAFEHKIAAVRAYGGEVVLCAGDLRAESERIAAERGYALVHPFDAPLTMAGQGTVAIELLEDAPSLDVVVVPVGGGGLISGVSAVFAELSPATRIVAVEPAAAAFLQRSLEAGAAGAHATPPQTIADGLAAPFLGAECFRQIEGRIDSVIELPDEQLVTAMAHLAQTTKQLVEPSGAAAFAAASTLSLAPHERRIGVILSGGNVSPEAVVRMAESLPTLSTSQRTS